MSDANQPAAEALPPDLADLRARLEASAVQRIAATNWFPPFALAMLPDGNVVDYSASLPADQATPEAVYHILVKGLSRAARQHRFRAVGVCHGIVVNDSGRKAIRLMLEQPDGTAREIIAPYVKPATGKPSLQQAQVSVGKPLVFAGDDEV